MLHVTKPPRAMATSAALEMVLLRRLNVPDNSHETPSAQELQARYVCARWQHISVPVARVIAELAFQAGRASA